MDICMYNVHTFNSDDTTAQFLTCDPTKHEDSGSNTARYQEVILEKLYT